MRQGFSCSQAVLAVMGPERGLDRETALRVAGALGAGINGPCGAVSGALMAIGLEHGRVSAEDSKSKRRCYDLGSEFVRRFRKAEGAIACRDLLGYDLSKPGGAAKARASGLFRTLCPRLVATAVEVVEALLIERPGPHAASAGTE